MSTEDNKLVVRGYIYEVVNTGNVDDIDRYISTEYYEGTRPTGQLVGIEGAKQHVLDVRSTYPDLFVTINRQIAEGDWVVTLVTARGTQTGEWLGIKPTHKEVKITAVNVDRVRDGKIVEHGGAANTFEALLEIGAIKTVS